jgi:hypothetical protein
MQDELNAMLKNLRAELKAGGEHESYTKRVHNAAASLHAAIAAACHAGYEVHACKGNGRVLKIGSVGVLHGTRFSYGRRPPDPILGNQVFADTCELAVIEELLLARGL